MPPLGPCRVSRASVACVCRGGSNARVCVRFSGVQARGRQEDRRQARAGRRGEGEDRQGVAAEATG